MRYVLRSREISSWHACANFIIFSSCLKPIGPYWTHHYSSETIIFFLSEIQNCYPWFPLTIWWLALYYNNSKIIWIEKQRCQSSILRWQETMQLYFTIYSYFPNTWFHPIFCSLVYESQHTLLRKVYVQICLFLTHYKIKKPEIGKEVRKHDLSQCKWVEHGIYRCLPEATFK